MDSQERESRPAADRAAPLSNEDSLLLAGPSLELILDRRRWALALIQCAKAPVPPYGSSEWLALPDGPEKVCAVVVAAECWAADGDDLDERQKQLEDEQWQQRRDAHRERWKDGRPKPDPTLTERITTEYDEWIGGGAA